MSTLHTYVTYKFIMCTFNAVSFHIPLMVLEILDSCIPLQLFCYRSFPFSYKVYYSKFSFYKSYNGTI